MDGRRGGARGNKQAGASDTNEKKTKTKDGADVCFGDDDDDDDDDDIII